MAEQKSKGMAVASLVLGIVAFIFCFIPFLNIIGWIVALLGIIFGIIGLVKKQGAMALVGLILSACAYFVPLMVLAAIC